MFKKNTAVTGFGIGHFINASTGAAVTTGTPTCKRTIDGTGGACANAASYNTDGAVWEIDLAAGDLNGDCIILSFTLTDCLPISYTVKTVTGVPDASGNYPADLADVAHGGASASLTLGAGATISNASGSALTLTSSGGNGHGMVCTGNGTGEGISATGGASGAGIAAIGGSTAGGYGIYAEANSANCYGLHCVGTNATESGGIKGVATTSGEGIEGVGAGNGHGLYIIGAGTGDGLHAQSGTGNGAHGAHFEAVGSGVSHGVLFDGNTGGDDIALQGDDAPDLNTVIWGSTSVRALTSTGLAAITAWTVNITGSVTSVTGSVGSVTGAVGSVTGAVGSVGSGGITAASIADGAIDAAAFAADAKPTLLWTGTVDAWVAGQLQITTNETLNGTFTGQTIVLYDADASSRPCIRRIVSASHGSTTIVVDSLPDFTPVTNDPLKIFLNAPHLGEILTDTAVIGTAGAGLTAVPWNAAWDAEVESECTDALNAYDPPTKAELDTAVANVSVDEIQASALADLFNTNSGTTYSAAVAGSPVKEIADNAGGSGLSEAGIADAVWNEALAGHSGAGSAGEALAAAGTAGDPWIGTIAEPATYPAVGASPTAGQMMWMILQGVLEREIDDDELLILDTTGSEAMAFQITRDATGYPTKLVRIR